MAAFGLTLAPAPYLPRPNFIFFSVAVLFAAWYAGFAAGVLASVATLLAVDYFFTPPLHALTPPGPGTFLMIAVFATASAVVSALTRAADRAQQHADEYAQQLQDQAMELEQQAAEARVLAGELTQANHDLELVTLEAESRRDHAQVERTRLQTVLDSLPDATNIYDRAWRWTYMNPVAQARARRLGRDPAALIGRCVWDEFPATRGTMGHDESVRALAEERIGEYEELGLDNRWYETRVVPMGDGVVTYSRDVTERNQTAEREHYLAEASERLASSLDRHGTLVHIAQLAVPTLADWCVVEIGGDGDGGAQVEQVEQVAIAHVDAARAAWAHEIRRRFPRQPDAPTGVAAVIRHGRTEFYPRVTAGMLAAAARDPEHLRLLQEIGFHSVIIAPLSSHGRTVGALTLVSAESRREFTEADVALAEELGRRAALALDNARLYAAEQRARLDAEAAASRIARLQAVTAALSATLTPTEVAAVVVEHGVAALDEDGEALTLLGWVGYPAEAVERYRRMPITADFPLAEAARLGEPIVLRTLEEREARYPHLVELRRANGTGAMIAVPLAVEERRVGVLGINFPTTATLDDEDQRFIFALAQQCAQALDRVRLYELEQAARRTAERLQALTAALSEAATPAAVGTVVLEQGVRALGAGAGVVVLQTSDGGALEIVASTGYPPEACMAPGRRWPAHAAIPVAEATRTGQPVLVESVEAWQSRYPGAHVPPRTANAAWAALPVGGAAADASARGALLWTFDGARSFGSADRALMETVARLCTQALERARLYEAERVAREEAQRQRGVAEDANRTKSEFLAVMSHELHTPLNAIGGYAELLAMGIRGPVTAAQLEDIARIQRSQRHLLSLVNDVLNFVRLDAGQVHYDITDVPLPGLITHVGTLVAPQLAAKALRFETRCDGEPRAVHADRDKVAQILINLLSNAIKFTPPGGEITLSCEPGTEGNGAVVLLRVSDTGLGIAPEHLESIFEPFVQVQRGLTRTSEGAGLGLAISRDLAQAMGGALRVETALGVGSVFTLALPAA